MTTPTGPMQNQPGWLDSDTSTDDSLAPSPKKNHKDQDSTSFSSESLVGKFAETHAYTPLPSTKAESIICTISQPPSEGEDHDISETLTRNAQALETKGKVQQATQCFKELTSTQPNRPDKQCYRIPTTRSQEEQYKHPEHHLHQQQKTQETTNPSETLEAHCHFQKETCHNKVTVIINCIWEIGIKYPFLKLPIIPLLIFNNGLNRIQQLERAYLKEVLRKLSHEHKLSPQWKPLLIAASKDKDRTIREKSAAALNKMKGETSKILQAKIVPIWLNALEYGGQPMLQIVNKMLREIEEVESENIQHEVLQALLDTVQDKDWSLREKAADALEDMGKKAASEKLRIETIQLLLKAIKGESPHIQDASDALLSVVRKLPENVQIETIPTLTDTLKTQESIHKNIIYALEQMQKKASETIQAELVQASPKALKDKCVCSFAAPALTQTAVKMSEQPQVKNLQEEHEELKKALKAENWPLCEQIISSLSYKDETSEQKLSQNVQALFRTLEDGNKKVIESVRKKAIFALVHIFENASENIQAEIMQPVLNALQGEYGIIQSLLTAWQGGYRIIHSDAIDILIHIFEKAPEKIQTEIVQALLKALNNKDWHMRNSIVLALGKVGVNAPENIQAEIIPGLVKALKDKEDFVRRNAVNALKKMRTALLSFILDHSIEITDELAQIFPIRTIKDHLIEIARKEKSEVGTCVEQALKQPTNDIAFNHLVKLLTCEDSNPITKREQQLVALALIEIGKDLIALRKEPEMVKQ